MNLIKIFQRFSAQKQLHQQILALKTPFGNVTDKIVGYTGRNLYKEQNHPLGILKQRIEQYFHNFELLPQKQKQHPLKYSIYDDFSPIVTVEQNFDSLLIPSDHISRKRSDTYYINESQLLRTHTSAYQKQLISAKTDAFLIFADVYRRDEIDATHYPVFHQMEGVRIYNKDQFSVQNEIIQRQEVCEDLQRTCEGMVQFYKINLFLYKVKDLFGDVQMRWVPAYFPFTEPSLELEIFYNNKWLEMLGCGVIHRDLMQNADRKTEIGWALGIGLERFAMILFDLPDIRLFWSDDKRFLSQFQAGQFTKFVPFSKYPHCYKDLTMWVNPQFEENDLFEIIRENGGDLIEKVECVDTYVNKNTLRTSKSYRIHYRSLERTLQNAEIDEIQFKIRENISSKLNLELR